MHVANLEAILGGIHIASLSYRCLTQLHNMKHGKNKSKRQLKYFSPDWCMSWPCPGYALWYAKSKVLFSFKLPLLSMEMWELVLSCRTGGLDFHSGCFVWQKASFSPEPWSSNMTPEFLGLHREQDYALFWQMLLCKAVTAELQQSLVRNPGLSKQVPIYCGEREGCWCDNWDGPSPVHIIRDRTSASLLSPVLPCCDSSAADPGNKQQG